MNRYILHIAVAISFIAGIIIAVLPAIVGGSADGLGGADNRVPQLEKPAERVVALSTAAVELLFAMGAGGKVVGATDYVVWPEVAKKIPKVGGWTNPNFEKITELEPDLIVIQGKHELVRKFAARRNIPILSLDSSTLDSVFSDITSLGRVVGMKTGAAMLKARMRCTLELAERAVEGRKKTRVLIVIGRIAEGVRQISTCGGNSFLSGIVRIAGGENIFSEMKGYVTVSREELVARAPEVILEMRPGEVHTDEERKNILNEFSLLTSLPAVRTGRIHIITDPSCLTAGARIHEIALKLADLIHPEIDWERLGNAGDFGK
ncbi:MAG: ABC transporter substrate-binding protein [Planctomycetota bacterium]|jgi:iron complex transport system substrate-binding protein